MGMYTEIDFNVRLRADVPQTVIDALSFMTGQIDAVPPVLPDHHLFALPRWKLMLRCDSAYFDAETRSELFYDAIFGQWFLNVRSNFKNYDGEIEAFIEWIDPYVDAFEGDFLGFYRYEETEDPTLIRKAAERTAESGSTASSPDPLTKGGMT